MIKERKEIENKYKWDIDAIYSGKENIIEDKNKIDEIEKKILSLKGKILESGKNLYEVLSLSDEAEKISSRIIVYTSMKRDEDNSLSESQSLASLGEKISIDLDASLSFITPEILSEGKEKIYALIDEYPNLKFYKKILDEIIRNKDIYLSEKEEKILSKTGEMSLAFENIYKMLSYVDLKYPNIKNSKGEELELNDANYSGYIRSSDRILRENAFKGMMDTYKEFENTYGAILASSIKKDVFYSEVRGFKTSLEGALFGDNIPTSVYNNVLTAAKRGIPLLDKYINIKKRELNVDKVHLYDLYAPLSKEVDMKIDYEDAKSMVLESLDILGAEYAGILNEAFNNRWIDVYYNKGKYTGAYSFGAYDTKPYILLNYKDKLDDVLTLAHEIGHSIHSYYSRKTQEYAYSSYTIFCAEVASITNECLMYLYLMDKLKGEERKYIIDQFLETIRTTFFRQALFAEFELLTHSAAEKGDALNGEELSKIWLDLYKKYYGSSCEIDEEVAVEWARVPHFYDSFYVYKYVTGISAGISMAKQIMDDNSKLEKYINFLKSGNIDYSINLLKETGIDFTTTKPLDDTLEMFEYLLSEYEK